MSTFHGMCFIPKLFLNESVFIGGDDGATMEILTTNPYCKGVGLLNNKMFWNPDLKLAQKIIDSGYGSLDEFRFFVGKMKWNNSLWQNIQERNLYSVLMTKQNNSASSSCLAKQIWSYHKSGNNESL